MGTVAPERDYNDAEYGHRLLTKVSFTRYIELSFHL